MIDVSTVKKWSPKSGEMTVIDPAEVSHVGRPANRRKYLFTKSHKGNEMDNLIAVAKSVEAANEPELRQALKSSGVTGDALEAALLINRLSQAFDEVDLASALGVEATEEPVVEPTANADGINKSELPEQVRKHLETLESQVSGLTKAIAEQRDRERLVKFQNDLADLTHLGDVNKVAGIVKSVDDVNAELATSLIEVLRSANEVASQGAGDLYKSVGQSGDGANVPDSIDAANDELDRRARELMNKSEEALTITKAYEQVLENDPALRARLYS